MAQHPGGLDDVTQLHLAPAPAYVGAPECPYQCLRARHQLGLRLAHRLQLRGELGAAADAVTLDLVQAAGHVRERLLDAADQLRDLLVLNVDLGLGLGAVPAQLRLGERDQLRRRVLERAGRCRLHALVDVGLDRAQLGHALLVGTALGIELRLSGRQRRLRLHQLGSDVRKLLVRVLLVAAEAPVQRGDLGQGPVALVAQLAALGAGVSGLFLARGDSHM